MKMQEKSLKKCFFGFIMDFKTFILKEFKKNILAAEPGIMQLFEEEG
jgi:hypothetical protein